MDLKTIKTKIKKVKAQLERERIKLKKLEARRAQLENEQIINVVRQGNITLAELDEFLKLRKEGKVDKLLNQTALQ